MGTPVTATEDIDYVGKTGTLTFDGTDGETKQIFITVLGDTIVEQDETFTVELNTPVTNDPSYAVGFGDNSGLGTILDNDSAEIQLLDATASGSSGIMTFEITLSAAVEPAFSITVSTVDTGSAADGTDFFGFTNQQVNFAGISGEVQTVDVTIVGTKPTATGIIYESDTSPDFYIANSPETLFVIASQGVLANDGGACDGSGSATLVSTTSNGNLAFNSDGSFSYTPSNCFVGIDSFAYSFDGDQETAHIIVNRCTSAYAVIYTKFLIIWEPVAEPGTLTITNNNGGATIYTETLSAGEYYTTWIPAGVASNTLVDFTITTASVTFTPSPAQATVVFHPDRVPFPDECCY